MPPEGRPFGSLSFTQAAVGTAVFHTFATAASEARATQPATQAVLRLSTQPKTSWQAPAQQGTSLRTSAPLHRIASPRPRPPALTSGFTSSYSQQANLRESLMVHWRSILAVFAEHSQLHRTCIASMHPMEILRTSLRRFAASTISQYLKILQTCLVFWQSMLWSPTALSLPQLADFLQACQSSQEEDRPALKCSPKQAVKALSWLARTAQIADLATLLSNTLIRSFSLPCAPQERKEALPLPLATLVAWEQKLLQPDCPASLGLLLGGVLLAAHCSLRFKDSQRISFHSLSLSAHALRGTCWATKTTSQGQPFACQPFGFTGTSTSTSWVVAWLRLLEQAWQATKTRFTQDTTPDFLLPCLSPLDSFHRTDVVFSGPIFHKMGAANPLAATRLRPGYTDRGIGFHAAQLENMPFKRLCTAQIAGGQPPLQGHHKLSSAQLYSRDDTIEALWLQRQLSTAARGGWRPPRPQARGGQHPTIEPPFVLQGHAMPDALCLAELEKAIPSFLYSREIAALSQPGTTRVLDSDEEATAVLAFALDQSNSESESSSGTEPDKEDLPSLCIPCKAALGACLAPWGVTHAIQYTDDTDASCNATACGLALRPGTCLVYKLSGLTFCQRKACKAFFAKPRRSERYPTHMHRTWVLLVTAQV